MEETLERQESESLDVDGRNELSDTVETMIRTHLELAGNVENWQRTGLEGEANLMLIRCQRNAWT